MDEAGVDAALIHPPTSWDPNSQADGAEAAKEISRPLRGDGHFDPKNPANRKR